MMVHVLPATQAMPSLTELVSWTHKPTLPILTVKLSSLHKYVQSAAHVTSLGRVVIAKKLTLYAINMMDSQVAVSLAMMASFWFLPPVLLHRSRSLINTAKPGTALSVPNAPSVPSSSKTKPVQWLILSAEPSTNQTEAASPVTTLSS